MKKIIVIGCPGSGKSSFSKKLQKMYNLPLYHLDLIWNKPDKTTISREEFDQELSKIFTHKKRIVEKGLELFKKLNIIEDYKNARKSFPL